MQEREKVRFFFLRFSCFVIALVFASFSFLLFMLLFWFCFVFVFILFVQSFRRAVNPVVV